ncbi:DUF2721 domain-containing protein [Adhaeribacter rhizoryzae]|uniref:DUF2721 domain-containing protein n=1 Tax=Adhaeribacter rhizoryzae TaxID=2607907 RepID=A0A5M6DTF0_9BACT|nr:DUF2721 domain-containing protein [Adhaeribacter rhizoryzae]KAA5549549.1 DUF2721 domain-containing protein [Adhaeribacter rhizoryzae]
MEITITTPALLFPAISLLLLAFTNRFIALASLVRNLKEQYVRTHSTLLMSQISNLRERLILIRNMQTLGISSMFVCVLCMFVLFAGELTIGKYLFAFSLVLLMASLALSIREIQISVNALKIELSDMEDRENQKLQER